MKALSETPGEGGRNLTCRELTQINSLKRFLFETEAMEKGMCTIWFLPLPLLDRIYSNKTFSGQMGIAVMKRPT